ncbi:MAG TPA: PEGA domain-containing protein [Candidatus Woesebacteria bacterium]|nr:PEGA domain-containing protein [Candidatus Woesebacteria bacterium]
MLKKAILVIICSLFLTGCSLTPPAKSAIEIHSTPQATVFINGREAGITPYKNTNLTPQEITVKLAFNDQWVEKKINLKQGLTSVLDWKFDENGNNGGYLLTMEKTGDSNCSLLINSIPARAVISLDNQIIGSTPKKIDRLEQGEKQITISFPNYQNINLFLRTTPGYNLIVTAELIKNIRPTESSQETTPINQQPLVRVRETETGWLNVRDNPSTGGREITKIKPDEEYQLLEKTQDWLKIELKDGRDGWIAAKYGEIISR